MIVYDGSRSIRSTRRRTIRTELRRRWCRRCSRLPVLCRSGTAPQRPSRLMKHVALPATRLPVHQSRGRHGAAASGATLTGCGRGGLERDCDEDRGHRHHGGPSGLPSDARTRLLAEVVQDRLLADDCIADVDAACLTFAQMSSSEAFTWSDALSRASYQWLTTAPVVASGRSVDALSWVPSESPSPLVTSLKPRRRRSAETDPDDKRSCAAFCVPLNAGSSAVDSDREQHCRPPHPFVAEPSETGVTSTPSETLSTESRLTAPTFGTGSTFGSSTTSLGRWRIVVVHGAMRARPRRGIADVRD